MKENSIGWTMDWDNKYHNFLVFVALLIAGSKPLIFPTKFICGDKIVQWKSSLHHSFCGSEKQKNENSTRIIGFICGFICRWTGNAHLWWSSFCIKSWGETFFVCCFKYAAGITRLINTTPVILQVAARQDKRPNAESNKPFKYYYVNMCLPFLDHFLNNIDGFFL